jgi:NAD(P)-dependent dehydrogenase (short-subunit alcohol dehydrogenase family)
VSFVKRSERILLIVKLVILLDQVESKETNVDELKNKTILVTGGSQGLGRGIVEVLAGQGATVWALARDPGRLEQLSHDVPGVQTRAGDITDPQVVIQALRDIRPQVLVLNAGARPAAQPVQEQSWELFSRPWETDVKATFYFGKEALLMPMAPGGTVVIMSSGAALAGSPLSGGYAGAKRTQWLLAQYFQDEANRLQLGLRFVALLPRQIIAATGLGQRAATAYAAREGITLDAYLSRFGVRLTPQSVGQAVAALLTDAAYHEGTAYGLSGEGLAAM